MKERQNKTKTKTMKKHIRVIPLLGLFVFLLFVGSSAVRLWTLNNDINTEIQKLNNEKASLLNQQKQLEEEIVRLNTPSYIEQLAREELGLVRPGEVRIAPKKLN